MHVRGAIFNFGPGRIAIATTVLVIAAVAVWLGLLETRDYASPEQAVKTICHAKRVIGVDPAGVEWQANSNPPGTGWIASIKHDFGARYAVQDCKARRYTHG